MSDEKKTNENETNEATGLNGVLCAKWSLGAMDRGMGHYSYAVMTEDSEMVIECKTDRELAEHIIELHNDKLSA